ncbi:hypothetical protein DFP93_11273 [Aneurinibacillus soli]|uniref:Uncharacterized protein n=1 Tax=Aneurinibacillus soli TaxID=1500254 RepID=A0A0U5CAP7_9BACL|nr:hypothetical protein [Aneurinibacillus soli]PYE60633.1 hypothetical protein DFP93_11273 [Aneurinibacillus soli]BAU29843.1 hypothetical protein CB4_04097 [Aneurinibacillus soli]
MSDHTHDEEFEHLAPIFHKKLHLREVVLHLMESIADEEFALAKLVCAEADKIHAFVGEKKNFPTCPHNQQIIDFNQEVSRLIEAVVMKEWLLLKKLEDTIRFVERPFCEDEE